MPANTRKKDNILAAVDVLLNAASQLTDSRKDRERREILFSAQDYLMCRYVTGLPWVHKNPATRHPSRAEVMRQLARHATPKAAKRRDTIARKNSKG